MLSAPPLPLHPPQLGALSSSASTSLRAGDASKTDTADGEEDNINNDDFSSLMANLFSRLKHSDDTVSEQEMQEIHCLLNLAISEDDGINRKSSITQTTVEISQEEMENPTPLSKHQEKAQDGLKGKPSPPSKENYAHGKENASPNNPPQRNRLSRRERSSRITTHRKPFVVDVRSFGSILNNNALGKCQKPQDVLAFWEAADEREASEAIMAKLRGRCEGNGTTSLRRLGVRRKSSQRTTTRLKRFAVELPSCSEQVQSLDQEQLEEDEDAAEESSFTFLSNPEFRDLKQTFEQKMATNQIPESQLTSPQLSVQKGTEITYLDGGIIQAEEDHEVLSDGKSPLVLSTDIGQTSADLPDATASKDEAAEHTKQSRAADMVDIARNENAADLIVSVAGSEDRNVVANENAVSEPEMKATPYNRKMAAKRTPLTSPTPPSNPLAALGLRKETILEDMSKRRLDFDDTTDLAALGSDSPTPVTHNAPCLQISSCSPGIPEAFTEEVTLEPAKRLSAEVPNSFEKIETKPSTKNITKRKKPMENRRDSLEGAGTNWKEGQRRSTRIKSRPLEWWRGERFLRGRVHKSLVTVIGIKYSSPPPCWSKRGTTAPTFKVESYVSEDYAKYVQFAALG